MIYDPNDPELKESMKCLSLPAEERIKLQSQPFDGKKQCWAPEPKESFVPAEIQSTKGEEVTVKTEKGEVCALEKQWTKKEKVQILDSYIEKRWYSTDESS